MTKIKFYVSRPETRRAVQNPPTIDHRSMISGGSMIATLLVIALWDIATGYGHLNLYMWATLLLVGWVLTFRMGWLPLSGFLPYLSGLIALPIAVVRIFSAFCRWIAKRNFTIIILGGGTVAFIFLYIAWAVAGFFQWIFIGLAIIWVVCGALIANTQRRHHEDIGNVSPLALFYWGIISPWFVFTTIRSMDVNE